MENIILFDLTKFWDHPVILYRSRKGIINHLFNLSKSNRTCFNRRIEIIITSSTPIIKTLGRMIVKKMGEQIAASLDFILLKKIVSTNPELFQELLKSPISCFKIIQTYQDLARASQDIKDLFDEGKDIKSKLSRDFYSMIERVNSSWKIEAQTSKFLKFFDDDYVVPDLATSKAIENIFGENPEDLYFPKSYDELVAVSTKKYSMTRDKDSYKRSLLFKVDVDSYPEPLRKYGNLLEELRMAAFKGCVESKEFIPSKELLLELFAKVNTAVFTSPASFRELCDLLYGSDNQHLRKKFFVVYTQVLIGSTPNTINKIFDQAARVYPRDSLLYEIHDETLKHLSVFNIMWSSKETHIKWAKEYGQTYNDSVTLSFVPRVRDIIYSRFWYQKEHDPKYNDWFYLHPKYISGKDARVIVNESYEIPYDQSSIPWKHEKNLDRDIRKHLLKRVVDTQSVIDYTNTFTKPKHEDLIKNVSLIVNNFFEDKKITKDIPKEVAKTLLPELNNILKDLKGPRFFFDDINVPLRTEDFTGSLEELVYLRKVVKWMGFDAKTINSYPSISLLYGKIKTG